MYKSLLQDKFQLQILLYIMVDVFTFAQFLWWAFRVSFCFLCFRPHGVQGEAEVSQVSVSAGWQGHEEDICVQRQRLHAAVCTA